MNLIVTLTDRDREVFQQLLDTWDDSDHPLPGRLSYQDVLYLVEKVGLPKPPRLVQLCDNPKGYFGFD